MCHEIFTDNFGIHCVAAKVLPCLLSKDQKHNCVDVSQELYADENFLKNIVTGDETWLYVYDVETKTQSSKRASKSHPDAKKHGKFGPVWKCCWLFFIVGVLFIMSSYFVATWWTRNVSWRWRIGWERQWGEKCLICGGENVVAQPWECNGGFLPSGSWFSHKTWDNAHPPASILDRPCTSGLFSLP